MITTKIMSLALISMMSATTFAAGSAVRAVDKKVEIGKDNKVDAKALEATTFGKDLAALKGNWSELVKKNPATAQKIAADVPKSIEATKLLAGLDSSNINDRTVAQAGLQIMAFSETLVHADTILNEYAQYKAEGGKDIVQVYAKYVSKQAVYLSRGQSSGNSKALAIINIRRSKGLTDAREINALNDLTLDKVPANEAAEAKKLSEELNQCVLKI